MFGGPDGFRRILSQETVKPRNLGDTLARFASYFKPYWYVLVLVVMLVVISTWAQVTSPELIGQLVDCYLTPSATASIFGGALPQASQASPQSNCWLASGREPHGFTQTVIKIALTAGGFPAPSADPSQLSASARIAGLGRMVLILVILYLMGSAMTGALFFTMTWAGQHVLRSMRTDVFKHLHRLHLGYYGEQEASDLISRITNDKETI